MIVVDTNVISYLLIPGAYTQHAQSAFLNDPYWIAPYLWRSEFKNVIALYIRHKKMTIEHAANLIEEAEKILTGKEYQPSSNRILKLISESKCSAYDCEFVALASLLDVPLITSDKKILKEFPKYTVSLQEFLK